MEQIIEIKKNKSNYVQIELREYEGHKYVDVREFYDAEDGKRLPTKKGITFSPKVLEEVSRLVGVQSKEAILEFYNR